MSKKNHRQRAVRNLTQPRDVDRWLARSSRQLVASDYPGIIATAQRVLRTPIASLAQRAEAYDRLAAAYTMLQQHENAYAAISEAVALIPENPLFWYNRGITALYTTRIGRSLYCFERAMALDVDGVLADNLEQQLQFARSSVNDALALRDSDFTLDQLIVQEETFQEGVLAMSQGRWAEAEPLFRQSIAMGDVLPQPWGNLGLCLLMQRQFDAAEAALRRALEIDPAYTIARRNLAGLPAIRASGKLPAMHMNTALDGRPANIGITVLSEGGKQTKL